MCFQPNLFFQTSLWVIQILKRMHLDWCRSSFIARFMETGGIVKPHFWSQITPYNFPIGVKNYMTPLTFYHCIHLPVHWCEQLLCSSPWSETYYKFMQQIVEFRWFVLLSRVQGKIYVVTNETFPNLLFSTLCTQFNSKNLFGMNFCLEIGAS